MNSNQEIKDSYLKSAIGQPIRERVGLVVDGMDARTAITSITTAEGSGVRQIWMTQSPFYPDTITIFAAAATTVGCRTRIFVLGAQR